MRRSRRDEKGAILVVSTLVAVGALLMAGLVLDLGQLRIDRRVNKGYTDVAARAGMSRLPFGPWSGVCKAREFLLGNTGLFSSFDPGSETWSNVSVPATVKSSSPCPAVATAPDTVPCAPNTPSTWAKLQATADGGRFTIMIQSGYFLPDPAFPADAGLGDTGASELGSCDNLAVVLTERETPAFAQVGGGTPKLVRVRSVARLNSIESPDFIAALQLLERTSCDVLQTGGSNTRVIAQSYTTAAGDVYPGTIQIDSIGDGSCPSPILNAQATSGGPSVMACSADATTNGCTGGGGTRPSRIGIYAINFNKAASIVSSSYPTTYGDTKAIPTPRTGRVSVDVRYRANVAALDAGVKAVMSTANHLPPGCTSVVSKACTGNGITWLVLQPGNGQGNNASDCADLPAFFSVAGRTAKQNIWFDCDLNVTAPLTLSAADSYIVVTGSLAVNSTFTITDPRKVYVGGRDTGNKVGLDLTGSGSTLNMNAGGVASCPLRTGSNHPNVLVVGKGSLKAGSGSTIRMCQTFVYLASGYDKVPVANGVYPCPSSASSATYSGTISVSSGSFVDLSAPNQKAVGRPTATDLLTMPFEDLAFWTEAGGNTNGLAGGGDSTLQGVYFLPNADSFNLSGGAGQNVTLRAQFVSTSMKVTGGAVVNLVPNPDDSIPSSTYVAVLVR